MTLNGISVFKHVYECILTDIIYPSGSPTKTAANLIKVLALIRPGMFGM